MRSKAAEAIGCHTRLFSGQFLSSVLFCFMPHALWEAAVRARPQRLSVRFARFLLAIHLYVKPRFNSLFTFEQLSHSSADCGNYSLPKYLYFLPSAILMNINKHDENIPKSSSSLLSAALLAIAFIRLLESVLHS